MRKQKFNRGKMFIKVENITFYSEMYLSIFKQSENLRDKFG